MPCSYTGAIAMATVTGGTGAITKLQDDECTGGIEHWSCCHDVTDPPPPDASTPRRCGLFFFSRHRKPLIGGSAGFGGGGIGIISGGTTRTDRGGTRNGVGAIAIYEQ